MKYLKLVYKKDPRRWIPTIFFGIFLLIGLYFGIFRGEWVEIWPLWAILLLAVGALGIDTVKQINKLKSR